MNVNDKLKELLANQSRPKVLIATELGMSNAQALDSRLRSSSTPKIDFVAALLDELGYALVVVPKQWLDADAAFPDGKNPPKDKFVIERDFEYQKMGNRAKGAAARVKKQREAAQNTEK